MGRHPKSSEIIETVGTRLLPILQGPALMSCPCNVNIVEVFIQLVIRSSGHPRNCRCIHYKSLGTKIQRPPRARPMSFASPHHCQSQSRRRHHRLHSLALGCARDGAASCQSAGVYAVCWHHPHPPDRRRASVHRRPRLSGASPSCALALCPTSQRLHFSLPCPP
jgi:hypothetical protein